MDTNSQSRTLIHWFRHGLRLHDMPSLVSGLEVCSTLYPIFIFDGETAGTRLVGYNRLMYLLEALQDLNDQFQKLGGCLYVFYGDPVGVFRDLISRWKVTHVSFEQDPEPIWKKRDESVKRLCESSGVTVIEKVSHTLWNPTDIIKMNGGSPPLTYNMFCHVTDTLGPPPRPIGNPDLMNVSLPTEQYANQNQVPTPEKLGIFMEEPEQITKLWTGGESRALQHLEERLVIERAAYRDGYYLPNQFNPDLLGSPMSMSAALRFGCLSVRKFFWDIHDLYEEIHPNVVPSLSLTGQLVWREYFYTMSVNNLHYDTMIENPICLNIPWQKNDEHLRLWELGKTGYPFIDAAMRQLRREGWIHHVARNAVACFLTRGDLWISWENGLKVFLKYLLDADWSVCAGNWMWVSSSAFENILQCTYCISPIHYGCRLDPTGEYIRRHVPELKKMPTKYVFEPWKAPLEVQQQAECIVGKDYPEPIVNHQVVSAKNRECMIEIRDRLLGKQVPPHCAPSSHTEAKIFMWLPDKCLDNVHPCNL